MDLAEGEMSNLGKSVLAAAGGLAIGVALTIVRCPARRWRVGAIRAGPNR